MNTSLLQTPSRSQGVVPPGWAVLNSRLVLECDRQILQLIGDGLSLQDISELIMRPAEEIEQAVSRLCATFGAASFAQLRRWYSLN